MATLKYRDSNGNFIAIPSVAGPAGVGIQSMTQTTSSSASGGSNVWTATMTNGAKATFTVKNGAQGPKGDKGDTGGIQDVAESSTKGYIVVTKADGTTKNVPVGDPNALLTTGGTMTGELINTNQNAYRMISGNYGFIMRNDGDQVWFLLTKSGDQYGLWNDLRPLRINCGNGAVTCGTALYGAVWNDYAEFRICKEQFTPGQVVYENGDDTLSISTKRLQRGCSIVSDTFGFAIGETDDAKCPIAVSGRVLAYPFESREEFKKHIGWPVCSGPNGTVSIMTEEEEEKYPSRIIGTISSIPDYETWGTGNVEVKDRVWIKVV